jgi:hypothetical protein
MIGWVTGTIESAAVFHGPLLAYVDPGAGSFLLQALVAAMAGIIVTVNIYWKKIKTLFGFGAKPDESEASQTGSESRDE